MTEPTVHVEAMSVEAEADVCEFLAAHPDDLDAVVRYLSELAVEGRVVLRVDAKEPATPKGDGLCSCYCLRHSSGRILRCTNPATTRLNDQPVCARCARVRPRYTQANPLP